MASEGRLQHWRLHGVLLPLATLTRGGVLVSDLDLSKHSFVESALLLCLLIPLRMRYNKVSANVVCLSAVARSARSMQRR